MENPISTTFPSDKVRIKVMADGGYQVIIDTGEYAQKAMQELIGMPLMAVKKITIELDVEV